MRALSADDGGLPCASCHTAEGRGGNLGTNLAGVFLRMGGELPLISAIEQAKFKILEPHYRRHPVTKQEAMHLAKYLSTQNPTSLAVPPPRFKAMGTGSALAGMAGLVVYLRRQRHERRREVRLRRRR